MLNSNNIDKDKQGAVKQYGYYECGSASASFQGSREAIFLMHSASSDVTGEQLEMEYNDYYFATKTVNLRI